MIDVNELRRNNLVYRVYKTHKLIVKGLVIDDNFINYINNSKIEAIPLTEDILFKCGFELFPWGWVSAISEERRSLRITIHKYFEREGQRPLKIKFVHNLQNLYWCLVGEELEITL